MRIAQIICVMASYGSLVLAAPLRDGPDVSQVDAPVQYKRFNKDGTLESLALSKPPEYKRFKADGVATIAPDCAPAYKRDEGGVLGA
ncbi:hypothetical protein EXIGLDRAFT_779758 [Exidia glandulosa HHB12029]|uniref:Uncharacterized protein n=1 Tax=Exidia glandulosa HHB12029 TaxID=1314781 RepID=A0A165BWR1_EXIGL|nr:hypothetical protein EXIGLDRAFT_779758 [Exidia glandulosa HHB12029]